MMSVTEGLPTWYSYASVDVAAGATFYGAVFGWTIADADAAGRQSLHVAGSSAAVGDLVARSADTDGSGWRLYVAVDDLDRTAAAIVVAGGTMLGDAHDVAGVGRVRVLRDPLGAALLILRPADDLEGAYAYDASANGRCHWNELASADGSRARAFYAAAFGWTYPKHGQIEGLGDYHYAAASGQMFGAVMDRQADKPMNGWTFYFRVKNIDGIARRIADAGGAVLFRMTMPSRDDILVARDDQGAIFGCIAGP